VAISSGVIARGVRARSDTGIADGATRSKPEMVSLPVPRFQLSPVSALRPAWPSCMPILPSVWA
jgi:hypothetical protein